MGKKYTHRMFTAFFQEKQDIEEVEALVKLATESGLGAAEFLQALKPRKYKEVHQQELCNAYEEL